MVGKTSITLLETHSIDFTRHGSDTDKTYVDEYGNIVSPTTTTTISTIGSLQPFSKYQSRVGLEEGFREEDYFVYYSKDVLRTTNQFDNNLPDTCVIDGNSYKVTRKGLWTSYGLLSDNNEYYLQLIQPQGS